MLDKSRWFYQCVDTHIYSYDRRYVMEAIEVLSQGTNHRTQSADDKLNRLTIAAFQRRLSIHNIILNSNKLFYDKLYYCKLY